MGLPVQSQPFTTDGQIIGGRVIYYGINVVETGGAIASIIVYDGTSTSGKIIDRYGLAIAGSDHDAPFNRGVLCEQGIYVDITSDGLTGICYYLPGWVLDATAVVEFSGSQRYVERYMTQPDIYRGFDETEA